MFPAVITRGPGAREDARLKYVIDFAGVSTGTEVVCPTILTGCARPQYFGTKARRKLWLTTPFSVTFTAVKSTGPTVVTAITLFAKGSALRNWGVTTID